MRLEEIKGVDKLCYIIYIQVYSVAASKLLKTAAILMRSFMYSPNLAIALWDYDFYEIIQNFLLQKITQAWGNALPQSWILKLYFSFLIVMRLSSPECYKTIL